jgi:hypothetical protein
MNDLICSSSVMPLRDRTSNSLMCDIKSSNYLWPIIDRNHLVKKCKTRSHVKHGLLWLDCDSQIRTKLANLWEIFDRILKNGLFDAQSFWFIKESLWFQKLAPWCRQDRRTELRGMPTLSIIVTWLSESHQSHGSLAAGIKHILYASCTGKLCLSKDDKACGCVLHYLSKRWNCLCEK